MREIKLTQGFKTIVDDDTYEKYGHLKFYASCNPRYLNSVYAVTRMRIDGKSVLKSLQRLILNPSCGLYADHINRDTLDNRKCNLRVVTGSQNVLNAKHKGGSSIYRGVAWHKTNKRWVAKTRRNYKQIHIGSFRYEKDAAHAYDKKAKEVNGEFAQLNFPQTG